MRWVLGGTSSSCASLLRGSKESLRDCFFGEGGAFHQEERVAHHFHVLRGAFESFGGGGFDFEIFHRDRVGEWFALHTF